MNRDWIDGVICDTSKVIEPLKKAGFTVVENVVFHGQFVGSNGKAISGELRDTYCQLLQLNYGRRRQHVEIPLRHLEFWTRKPLKTLERHLPELVACGLLDKEIRKNGKLNLPTRYIFRPFPVKEMFRTSTRIRYFHTLSANNPPMDSDQFDGLFDDIWTEVGAELEKRFKPARMTMKQAEVAEQHLGILEQMEQAPLTGGRNTQLTPARHAQPVAVVNDTPTLDDQVAERIGQARISVTLTDRVAKWKKSFKETVILAAVDHAVGGAGSKTVTLNWIDTILADWHRQGVFTVADAERVINDHRDKRRKQREVKEKTEVRATPLGQRASKPKGRFGHFVDR